MLLVVVQLVKPKKRIIVPENFVYDLDEEKLKNVGKNGNVTYKVYWSKAALGDEKYAPNEQLIPNFNAAWCEIYPPNDDLVEACYKARIITFYSKCQFFFLRF